MKNKTLIIGIILLIILCGVALLVYKEMKKDSDKEKSNKEVELKLSDSLVLDADKILGHELCGGYVLDFENKSFELKDISDSDKLDMIYYYYMPYNIDTKSTYTVKDVERFFEDTSFLGKDGVHNAGIGSIIKNGNNLSESVVATGCEMAYDGYNMKAIKAIKKDNTLEITYIIFYQIYDYENERIGYYKDKNSSKALYEDVEFDNEGNVVTKFDNALFNKYVISYDIKDNNLRFINAVFKEV